MRFHRAPSCLPSCTTFLFKVCRNPPDQVCRWYRHLVSRMTPRPPFPKSPTSSWTNSLATWCVTWRIQINPKTLCLEMAPHHQLPFPSMTWTSPGHLKLAPWGLTWTKVLRDTLTRSTYLRRLDSTAALEQTTAIHCHHPLTPTSSSNFTIGCCGKSLMLHGMFAASKLTLLSSTLLGSKQPNFTHLSRIAATLSSSTYLGKVTPCPTNDWSYCFEAIILTGTFYGVVVYWTSSTTDWKAKT